MEEPDDDELLNEYIDDYEEPEHFLQEMIEELEQDDHPAPAAAPTNGVQGIQDDGISSPVDLNSTVDLNANSNFNVNHGDEDNSNDDLYEVANYIFNRNADAGLYNFERFKAAHQWRSGKTDVRSENTARNSTRSQLFKLDSVGSKWQTTKRLANSSDAQLLQLTGHLRKEEPLINLKKASLSPQLNSKPTPMTIRNGKRIFIATDQQTKTLADRTSSDKNVRASSLGISMEELKRRSDFIRRRVMQKSLPENNARKGGVGEGQLWVDKHAPTNFSHLLSDERTNREVLRAIRAWDPYVFGREPPPRPTFESAHSAANRGDLQPEENQMKRADKRPDEQNRVILLSGPPGVGKTTLAHIIAKKAGYRPFEVNASDDRSASVLMDKVQRAMESSTIQFQSNGRKGATGKPNCIILDEIDGADAKGSIQALVELIKAEIPASKAKKNAFLRRPIILICNHKYATALRPLLPLARHFHVQPPVSTRLVTRLKAILSKESFKVTSGETILHRLVQTSGGDIRSCMYTLQFVSAQAGDGKDLSDALSLSLQGHGLKDGRTDIGTALTAIFRKPKKSGSLSGFGVQSRDRTSLFDVFGAVERFGDSSSTINSLFLNLPSISFIDPTFDRASAAHEWLSFSDLLRSDKLVKNDNWAQYTMQRLLVPSTAAAIHLLCRVETKPKITVSTRELTEKQYSRDSNLGLLQRFADSLPPESRHAKEPDLLVKDMIPFLLSILASSQALSRGTSTIDVLTKTEREAVQSHVSILRSLGLSYATKVAEESEKRPRYATDSLGEKIQLEPPLERLVRYTSLKLPPSMYRKEIPAPMLELLSQQLRFQGLRNSDGNERMERRQADAGIDVQSHVEKLKIPQVSPSPERKFDKTKLESSPASFGSNFLGRGAKKAREAKAKRRAAAIGLENSKKIKSTHTGSQLMLSEALRLRYLKGFTQAVRTPCHKKDIL